MQKESSDMTEQRITLLLIESGENKLKTAFDNLLDKVYLRIV